MVDDCGAALDDDEAAGNGEEPAPRHLVELLPAAMIVGLAFSVGGALLRGAGSPPVESLETTDTPISQASVGAPPSSEVANFRFAAVPLRAALKEIGDRTGSIRPLAPAPLERVARPSVVAQDRLMKIGGRQKSARAVTEARPRASLLQLFPPKTKSADPLTVVGRTASAMAERFATDLRALPGQISTILNRQ